MIFLKNYNKSDRIYQVHDEITYLKTVKDNPNNLYFSII